jgi:hypothetical protein
VPPSECVTSTACWEPAGSPAHLLRASNMLRHARWQSAASIAVALACNQEVCMLAGLFRGGTKRLDSTPRVPTASRNCRPCTSSTHVSQQQQHQLTNPLSVCIVLLHTGGTTCQQPDKARSSGQAAAAGQPASPGKLCQPWSQWAGAQAAACGEGESLQTAGLVRAGSCTAAAGEAGSVRGGPPTEQGPAGGS